jgi:hypothetical protein
MRPPEESTSLHRRSRYEQFEERLALSGNPIGSVLPEQAISSRLEHHYEELTPLEPGVGFQLETKLSDVEHHTQALQPFLSDTQQLSGVQYVHNIYGFDGADQTVAIIDSGIAYDHLALGGGLGAEHRIVGGFDFAENDADPYDDGPAGFHGTHVAGILGSDNADHRGVAPGADLVALRVFDDQGMGYFEWVTDSLDWVHEHRDDFANPITTVNLSLGSTWNANDVPDWATLENKFAQLKADGIFLSVSAGNSFEEYATTGLSYPAASPFVVPVASVDDDGSFSSFSQRNDRVLAAPGRSITSTVPDHIFGSDGNPNDFGTSSGTSMAAPYVAGVSALVRQAMSFVGTTSITQDTIYDHLRSTSDVFYDAATNANYHRINVGSALDALMPDDDYGSSLATAHTLGTISRDFSLAGLIGTRTDQDYFRFTAGQTGEIRFSFDTTHDLELDVRAIEGNGAFSNNDLTMSVVVGQTYTVSVGTTDGIGYYDVVGQVKSNTVDLGTVAFRELQADGLTGETWYQITAAHAGHFTTEALFAHAGGDVDLEIYNANQQLLASSYQVNDNERIDLSVAKGTQLFVKLIGANSDVGLRFTNLLTASGSGIQLFGTGGIDEYTLSIDSAITVGVNGTTYTFGTASVSNISFDGGQGHDTIRITGDASGLALDLKDVLTVKELAYELDQDLDLNSSGQEHLNWRGAGEKWMLAGGTSWYFITADGALYEWSGAATNIVDSSNLVAQLDSSFYDDISKLYDAEPPNTSEDAATGEDGTVSDDGATSDDGTARDDGTANGDAGAEADAGEGSGQADDATDLLDRARELDSNYGFQSNGRYFESWVGLSEKWIRDESNTWFLITPDGTVFQWNGSKANASSSTVIANLDASFHADPRKLTDPPVDSGSGNDAGTDGGNEGNAGEQDGSGQDGSGQDGSAQDGGDQNSGATDGSEQGGSGGSAQGGDNQSGDQGDNQGGGSEDRGEQENGSQNDGSQDGRSQDNGSQDNGSQDNGSQDGGSQDDGANVDGAQDGDSQDGGSQDADGQDGSEQDHGEQDGGGQDAGGAKSLSQRAYELDQQLGLRFRRSYYPNFAGLGEKWIASDSGQWYFITPDGSLYRWNGSRWNASASELVATLDSTFHANPGQLHDAPQASVLVAASEEAVNPTGFESSSKWKADGQTQAYTSIYSHSIVTGMGGSVLFSLNSKADTLASVVRQEDVEDDIHQTIAARDSGRAVAVASLYGRHSRAENRGSATMLDSIDETDELKAVDAIFDTIDEENLSQREID